jgi:hypothetical protein
MCSIERRAKRRQSAGLSCSVTICSTFVSRKSGTNFSHSMMPSPVAAQPSSVVVPLGEFDGGHGRYAYYDTVPDLGVMIELLEFDSDNDVQLKQV